MIESIQEFIQQPWAYRALLASSLAGIMCGILGCFIVLRNMALIGDALAHAILPGIFFAFIIVGYSTIAFFTGAVIAGLVTSILITWIQHNIKTKNDAVIGIVFTAMFAVGIMGISWISHDQGVHLDLRDFLYGNVLGVSDEDLYLMLGITIYVILSVALFYRFLFVTTFQPVIAETMGISVKTMHYFLMLLLSFAVVASLQTVGVILVVAMLITPASTALLLSDRMKSVIVLSALIGCFSSVLGLFLSNYFNTTPGPMMVITATSFYLMAALLAPKRGVISKYLKRQELQKKIQLEDTLKQARRLEEKGSLTLEELLSRVEFGPQKLNKRLQTLRSSGHITENANHLTLTDFGKKEANKLIRAHRLWESYLVTQMGLTEEQIHEDAEKYEHLLTEDILDEVDKALGYPNTDPHGSPIPSKLGVSIFPLIKMKLQQKGKIAKAQLNDHISTQLWQFGLLPDTLISLQNKGNDFVELQIKNKTIKIPLDLAQKINVET